MAGLFRLHSWLAGGPQKAALICAEIGANHNGDLDTALQMVDAAARAGCDAVKFQKRTGRYCNSATADAVRETPWGRLSYSEYRAKLEFGEREYAAIATHCGQRAIPWFASVWDEESVEFLVPFAPPIIKVPSAALRRDSLLRRLARTGVPVILSTGMSDMADVRRAVQMLSSSNRLIIAHCTSAYPCPYQEVNLLAIQTLQREFPWLTVGYSGHELGIVPTVAARALGATYLERHMTLDRTMWGTDQRLSLEPAELEELVRGVRCVEECLGDGSKTIRSCEQEAIRRLRA